jgi:hypothetical protein
MGQAPIDSHMRRISVMNLKKSATSLMMIASAALLLGLGVLESRAESQCTATELVKLRASDGAAGDRFGIVAIDGDTAVIGAPQDDDKGAQSGSAFVFRLDGSIWTEEAKLLASDGAAGDRLGDSVAIQGGTAVIGAWSNDANGTNSGAVYVFRYEGSNWIQKAKLVPSDGSPGDIFGWAVAIDDDKALIAATYDDDNGTDAGSAYVFRYDGSSWVQEAKLLASDGGAGDFFGESVAIDGDVAVIGSSRDLGDRWGSAYVFRFDGADWIEEGKLLSSGSASDDFFGWTEGISGDTIVAGAFEYFDGPGSAYMFRHDGANWVEEARLLASDGTLHDAFGRATAIFDDTLVVGAEQSYGNHGPGAAYVFRHDGSEWVEKVKLLASDGAVPDRFGRYVATDGDVVLIGAWLDDDAGTDSGSAYAFHGLSDCNDNDTLDICDIATSASEDANNNGIPDECDDTDGDGLLDKDEVIYGTDPLDPDTDDDGLLDGTEVDMALGTGCPDPINIDSDGDTLQDGAEVTLGANPCNMDTDEDGIPDAIDPYPTDPAGTGSYIEEEIRTLADYTGNMDVGLLTGPNSNANRGRRNALSNKANAAANAVRSGDYGEAVDILSNLRGFIDGVEPPPDWMGPCAERDHMVSTVDDLIALLGYL